MEEETVWLTQEQMASLFGKGRSTIAEHITNVFEEGELEGLREVEREVDYYNLDVIISVGYRVKSPQGTQLIKVKKIKWKPSGILCIYVNTHFLCSLRKNTKFFLSPEKVATFRKKKGDYLRDYISR